jgi:oligopeptidase A
LKKIAPKQTGSNFVEPLEKIDEKLSRVWSQISHINSVMNSESFRKEYNKNLIKITNYYSELAQNSKIFKGYQFLKEKERNVELNAIQKKIVNDELKAFELGGIGLPKNKRESFKLIKSNLSKLSSQFEENILDSINDFSLHTESKIEVEGIPKDV